MRSIILNIQIIISDNGKMYIIKDVKVLKINERTKDIRKVQGSILY